MAKRLYSGKYVVFGQGGFIRTKVVVFGMERLYSGKRCCIQAKVVLFLQSGYIRAKVVVFEQSA